MRNRYAGTCDCGAFVDCDEGTVRKVNGKWRISCAACSPVAGVRFEVVRILTPGGALGDEISDPYPVLYDSLDKARETARHIYAGEAGFTRQETRDLLLCEIHRIELRGNSAFPVGFVECVAP